MEFLGLKASLCVHLSLSINIAQKPYIIGSLGPKALKYESLEGQGCVVLLESGTVASSGSCKVAMSSGVSVRAVWRFVLRIDFSSFGKGCKQIRA